MATILPIKYALDLTGVSPNNLVYEEPHALLSKKIRSIAPSAGPYYTDSLVVEDVSNNRVLTRNTDYSCLDVVGIPTVQSGKEICTIVAITNTLVGSDVRLSYQALGGGYQNSYAAIQLLIDNLTTDNRPVEWPNILGRPTEFDPAFHLHRVGDIVGFEYLVATIDKLKSAILLGDQLGHDELLTFIQTKIDALEALMRSGQNSMMAVALSRATNANTASTASLTAALATDTHASAAQLKAETALADIKSLLASTQSSETAAVSTLMSLPAVFNSQGNVVLNFTPAMAAENNLLFPAIEAVGLASTDYYGITVNGGVVMGEFGDTTPPKTNADYLFYMVLTTTKAITGGQAQIDLRINVRDQRNSALVGKFANDCVIELLPLTIDNGPNYLSTVYPSFSSMTYSEAPRDGVVRGGRYGIQGVDVGANTNLITDAVTNVESAMKIGKYLLDFRADHNVAGYGMVSSRRGVILNLPVGSELSFTFKLAGTSLAEIRKNVALMFKHRIKIYDSVTSGPSSSAVLIRDGLDSNKYRSICGNF